MGATLKSIWSLYAKALQNRPIRTQALTTAVLWSLGDITSQSILSAGRYQPKRTAATAAYSGLLVGPLAHVWYQWLDKAAKVYARPGTMRFIAGKVVADTVVFAPLHIIGFFAFMTMTTGGTWEDAKRKIKKDFIPTFAAECTVWPAIQSLNFAKVPVDYQLLVVNLLTILDSTFVCWTAAHEDWMKELLSHFKKED